MHPTRSRQVILFVALLSILMASAVPASAYWTATGAGDGRASTGTLAPPVDVEVPPTASTLSVPVVWTASTGVVPDGYYVTRTSGGVTTPACASSAAILIQATSCTDVVPIDGVYTYTAIAVYRSWVATSAISGSVTVDTTYRGPDLSGFGGFSVLAGAGGVVGTGVTTISGDVGVSPGSSITGFPPGTTTVPTGTIGGFFHGGDMDAAVAQTALTAALDEIAHLHPTVEFGDDLINRTFYPGVHHSTAAMELTGTLTLDGEGDPNSVFIFQVDAALNTAANSIVSLVNGAKASNVYWRVQGAAGTGESSSFSGTILAVGEITIGASGLFIGRALSQTTVTLADNAIRFTVALPPTVAIDGGATAVTTVATPTITGTTNAATGSPVIVTVDGQTLTSTVQTGGVWSVTAAAILAGTYEVLARVKDATGNYGRATQQLVAQLNPDPVDLGVAAPFSVLGAGVTSNGVSTMTGDLGMSPGTVVTGTSPVVGGGTHAGDTDAAAAQSALVAAIADATSRVRHTQFSGDLNGRTFHYGVHHTAAAMELTGTMTLDAEGDPDAVFIFKVDGALNTEADSVVSLVNGANASNVFWQVTGAAGTGESSSFSGTILATGAITLGAGSTLAGRALSRGLVTLNSNTISPPGSIE
jgi:Ice-binding-like/Bacterial Ig-like domain